ncbi:MAG: PAS domain S-box protein [Methylophilus sp.]|nr:PAS domain S-box protein [Methylophilus sp.]
MNSNLITSQNMMIGLFNILDQTGDYCYMKDLSGRYIYVNQKVQDLFEQPYENIIGKDDSHFFNLELLKKLRLNDRQVIEFGKTIELEESNIVKLTGEKRIYHVIKRPLRDSSGQVIGLYGISKDITESKRKESTLKDTLNCFNLLFTNMSNGFALHEVIRDSQGSIVDYKFLEVNPSFENITGIPRESWIGKRVKEVLPKVEHTWIERYGKVVDTGESVSFESYSSELRRWYQIYAYRPQQERFAVLVEDITKRKLAENALQIADIAFRTNEGIMVTDSQNIIIRVNESFTRITGYPAEEVIGKTPSILKSGHHDSDFYLGMWESIKKTGGWNGEIWNRRKDGKAYPEQLTITAVSNNEGLVTNYVATLKDNSDAKQQEQQRGIDETAHRDALVREVHHRIKNNLQGVIGVLRNFAAQYPELSNPLSKAISQVHSISVIHGLQGRATTTKVRLCELATEIAANNESLWNTPIKMDIPQNWIPSQVNESDSVPIAIVLNELISNAIKHGGIGKGVTVSLRHEPQPNLIQVTITNPGQLPEDFDFISSSSIGTGLQLVLSLLPKKAASLCFDCIDNIVSARLTLGPTTVNLEGN